MLFGLDRSVDGLKHLMWKTNGDSLLVMGDFNEDM
jgi:hypothetical protein